MFGVIKTLHYNYQLNLCASPLSDTVYSGTDTIPFFIASNFRSEYVRYNNYRLIWKFGIGYKSGQFSFGLNITSPSLNVYSDGKVISRQENRQNISEIDGSKFLPDYMIASEQEKDEVGINHKDPLSVSFGMN